MGWTNRTALLCFLALVLAAPYLLPHYFFKLNTVGIYALICIGLSLLLGYAGQISLGHAAFFGVGAYTSAILTTRFGWSPYMAVWPAIVMTVLIALAVGFPALKLHGHYLAMATLAFGMIVFNILNAWIKVSGGPNGLSNIPLWSAFGHKLKFYGTERQVFYIVWGAVVVGLVVALHLVHSRVGRALRAIHDGEEAATSLGVAASAYKLKVFVLSAVYASVAGSLYVHIRGSVTPDTFAIDYSILFIIMVIVGGMRNVWGAVLGAIVMGLVEETLANAQLWRLVVYGLVLGSMMMFIPQGVLPAARELLSKGWSAVRRVRSSDRIGEASNA
ncbi:MAG: branched-chain amino acid ABC transporter permease [Candidatus Sumerlaeota bacterium]